MLNFTFYNEPMPSESSQPIDFSTAFFHLRYLAIRA